MRMDAKYILIAACALLFAACIDEGVAPRDIRGDKRYDIPESSSSVASSSSEVSSSSVDRSLSSAEESSSSVEEASPSSVQYTVGYIARSDDANYKFTSFMGLTWIAKNESVDCYNLWTPNCKDSLGVCYGDDSLNCEKYGRLYTWAEAMHLPDSCNFVSCAFSAKQGGLCGPGYHVSTFEDWNKLRTVLLDSLDTLDPALYLKSSEGWDGENLFEFNVLPGGYMLDNGVFLGEGNETRFWAAFDSSALYVKFKTSDGNYNISGVVPGESRAYVRCVAN